MKIEIDEKNIKYLLMDLESVYLVKSPFPITEKLIKKLEENKILKSSNKVLNKS